MGGRDGGRAPGLTVEPVVGRVDEPVRVRGVGLAPGAQVTVGAAVQDGAMLRWRSEAQVTVRPDGTVDLSEQAPVSGDYVGVDWSGLLWSMRPAEGKRHRFFTKRRPTPMTVTFTLAVGGEVVATATADRHFGVGVRDRAAEEGLVGRLFSPGGSARPGVLLLAGSDGGVLDHAASLLAAEGYAVLSLALSGVEDRPQTLHHVDVEYCLLAIAWLTAQPECSGGQVAVVGLSRGAELALQLGALSGDVAAVVAGSPSHVRHAGLVEDYSDFTQPAWLLDGKPLPFLAGRYSVRTFVDFAGAMVLRRPIRQRAMFERLTADRERVAESRIEVERIQGPVLVVAGSDDQLWPSVAFGRAVIDARGGAAGDELLIYEGAGHFVCFPYALPTLPPMVRLSPPGPVTIDFGGTSAANAAAAQDSWVRIVRFLGSVSAG